jgi:hypothetical protein
MNVSRAARILSVSICATLVAGTAVSIAATAAKSGTIHGCVGKNGALRVVKSASKCGSKEKAISWNSKGRQGPAGAPAATKLYQINLSGAAVHTVARAFLNSPATVTIAGPKTAVLVTASLDFAPASDGQIDSFFEVCVKHGSKPIQEVSEVEPNFTATADNYYAQTVTGTFAGAPAGTYKVGACTAQEENVKHGTGEATVEVMQTTGGVTIIGGTPGF